MTDFATKARECLGRIAWRFDVVPGMDRDYVPLATAITAALEAENEACAKICDDCAEDGFDPWTCEAVAAAIRNRKDH
jgi:hypothetical protein